MKVAGMILFFLVIFGCLKTYAYHQEFRYLQAKDGLNNGEVNCIVQDQEGMMWFATWSGLVKYDGYNYYHYRPELDDSTSLPDKKINKLFVDSENNLWVATNRNLSRYVRSEDSFKTYRFIDRQVADVIIQGLAEVAGQLIIHEKNGFYTLPVQPEDSLSSVPLQLKLDNPDGLFSAESYNFSIGVGDTLFISRRQAQSGDSRVYSAALHHTDSLTGLSLSPFITVPGVVHTVEFVSAENCLYFATNSGIIPYSLTNKKVIKNTLFEGVDFQEVIYAANNHTLYASGTEPELFFIDLHTGTSGRYTANPYQRGSLLNNRIHTLFVDFSGNLWIGHQGQGISILNLNQKAFYTFRQNPFNENSLASNKVLCFEGNGREMFIGLRSGGINYLEKQNFTSQEPPVFKRVKIIQNNTISEFTHGVWDIAQLSEDVFFVGTDIGLLKLFKQEGSWLLKPFSDAPVLNGLIQKVYINNNKTLWCGAFDEGLILIPDVTQEKNAPVYQYKNEYAKSGTLSDNVILSMELDSKGRFWIGTVNGLNLLKTNYKNIDLSGTIKPDLRFKRIVAESGKESFLNNNEINCIYENFDGKLWLATMGGGINIMDPETGLFSHLTTLDGLPGDDVLAIVPDETGTLWISTTRGLVSYNQHQENPSFVNYNSSDGIQGNIFLVNSYYKTTDNELFFGGDNGFTRFYPKNIQPNPIKPKIVLTSFRLGSTHYSVGDSIRGRLFLQKPMNLTEKIELPYDHKTFSIGVAALHYQYPEGNKITYQLKGYDKEWRTIPAYYSNIYYSNLPPGKYVLHIKAISSDNQLSDQTRTLAIEIRKPWYFTWYMVILFILLAVGLIGGLIYILVNRQKLLFEKQLDRLAIENTESKMAFLTNIAHGLKTPLSLVIAPIDDLIQSYSDIRPEWKNHLHLIHRNANYLLKLINQIIDFRKLNAGKLKLYIQKTDIIRVIKDVITNFKGLENNKQVNIKLNLPFNSMIIAVDAQKIEEVLYNLVSNAFKNTPKYGNIIISMQLVQSEVTHRLKISVFNEGIALPPEDHEKIFERFYKKDENIEGAGIGLSFSQSLIEMHQGSIEVESIPGKGNVFHIYLPFTETDKNDKEENFSDDRITQGVTNTAEAPFAPPSETSLEPEKDLKIVLVEDNKELRDFLKNILSREYACFTASNGNEGIELIHQIVPDIVISDIIMPQKDGYEVCRQVKENINTCHIPVILLTAKNSPAEVISGYDVGADAYVTKPFSLDLITTQIARLIKNRELIRKKYQDQNFMIEVSPNKMSKDDEFILQVRSILDKSLFDSDYNVKKLAGSLEISSTQLYRKLKALTGYSPVEFLRILRLQKAYEFLAERNKSVKEVCYMSGFNNISYFIKCFREQYGVTPANLKDSGLLAAHRYGNTKHSSI